MTLNRKTFSESKKKCTQDEDYTKSQKSLRFNYMVTVVWMHRNAEESIF
jgi:hypothetical protein